MTNATTAATARRMAMPAMIQPHGVDSSLDDAAFVGVAAGAATAVVCVGGTVTTAAGGLAGGRCVRDGGTTGGRGAVGVGCETAGGDADRVGGKDVTGPAGEPPPPQAATSAGCALTSATAATRTA